MSAAGAMTVRAFFHQRKGRIVGEVVAVTGEWTHIRLTEDAWADARHRHRDQAGDIVTYRTSFLVEISIPGVTS